MGRSRQVHFCMGKCVGFKDSMAGILCSEGGSTNFFGRGSWRQYRSTTGGAPLLNRGNSYWVEDTNSGGNFTACGAGKKQLLCWGYNFCVGSTVTEWRAHRGTITVCGAPKGTVTVYYYYVGHKGEHYYYGKN